MSGRQWHTDQNGLRSGTFGYVHNLFGVYMDGSYSSMFTSVYNTDYRPGGYGIGGGLCYEHQRGMFRLNIGLGVRYQKVSNTVGDTTIYDHTVTDARGTNYTLRYDFSSRVDQVTSLNAQVPILMGLGVRGFFFLTGVKLNYSFQGNSHTSLVGTTTGTYQQFIGQFKEMDNHGLRKEVEVQQNGTKVNFKTDCMISLETGYEWTSDAKTGSRYRRTATPGERMEYRVRIAGFVDYGLVNSCPKGDKPFIYIPSQYKWDFAAYEFNHVFSSNLARDCQVHNFYAGVKLTLMLGFYSYKRCILCSDFQSEASVNTRGGKSK